MAKWVQGRRPRTVSHALSRGFYIIIVIGIVIIIVIIIVIVANFTVIHYNGININVSQ